jgi:hypothetical protein
LGRLNSFIFNHRFLWFLYFVYWNIWFRLRSFFLFLNKLRLFFLNFFWLLTFWNKLIKLLFRLLNFTNFCTLSSVF